MPMMMRARLRIGVDMHRPGPQLLRADTGLVDRGRAVHARRRGRVGVEAVAGDDGYAFVCWSRSAMCEVDGIG